MMDKNKKAIFLIKKSNIENEIIKKFNKKINISLLTKNNKTNFLDKNHLIIGAFNNKKDNLKLNKTCLNKNIKWLPYFVDRKNFKIDIGPLIFDKKNSCYFCYLKRLEENKVDLINNNIKKEYVKINYKILEKVASKKLINIVNKIIYKDSVFLSNKILTLYCKETSSFNNLYYQYNYLLKVPYCNSCLNIKKKTRIIKLKNKKIVYFENGLRTSNFNETWQRIKPLISHIGLINKVFKIKDYFKKINFLSLNASPIKKNKKRLKYGKGSTETQKKISACMEGIERYCFECFITFGKKKNEEIIKASYNEIKNQAINPHNFNILKKYNLYKKIKWLKVYSLTKNRFCYIPYLLGFNPLSTNGLASGNTLEEAILHGIFEVIERDLYMIVDLNKLIMPDVDIKTINNNKILNFFNIFEKNKIKFKLKYLNLDIKVPTFSLYLEGKINGKNAFSYAVGSHLNKQIALMRTITEAIQLFPKFQNKEKWLNKETKHYYLSSRRKIDFRKIESYYSNDLLSYIKKLIYILKKNDLEILLKDISLSFLKFKVVKIIIPKMQPIWFKETPLLTERVINVPKKLKLKKEISINKLNFGEFCGMIIN